MKAVFVDRDGTMIVEPPDERIKWVQDIQLFPDTIAALKLLQDNGFLIIEITNQAGIGEGLISLERFWQLEIGGFEAMLAKSGVAITKTFVCPHKADDGCDCRKPKPKMLLDAADQFDIDLSKSFMIGDNLSDVEAGRAAGAQTILVKTGLHDVEAPYATFTAVNLLEAARYVVDHPL